MPPTKRRRIEPADHGTANQQPTSQAGGSTSGFYHGFPDHMAHTIPLSAFELPQDRQRSDMVETTWATDFDALSQMPTAIDPYFLGMAQNAQLQDQVSHLQDQPAHLRDQSALFPSQTALDQPAPVFGENQTALQMWSQDFRLPVFPAELESRAYIKDEDEVWGKGRGKGRGKGKGKERAKAPPRKRAPKRARVRARATPPADDEAPEEGDAVPPADDEALSEDDEALPEDDDVPPARRRRRPKNAKIHIPPDRNLENLDDLIETELGRDNPREAWIMKKQRRLLKNREAALRSRQKTKEMIIALRVYKKGCVKTFNMLTAAGDKAMAELEEARERALEAERELRELRSTLALQRATAQPGAAPSRREIEGSSGNELMSESLFESAMQPDGDDALALHLFAASPAAPPRAAHDTTIDARAILHFFVHYGALMASGNSGVVAADLPAGVVAMAHAVTERMTNGSVTARTGFIEEAFDPLLNPVTEDLGARTGFDAAEVWATMPPAESVQAALDEFPVFLPEPAQGPADVPARPFGTIEPRGTKRRRGADNETLE